VPKASERALPLLAQVPTTRPGLRAGAAALLALAVAVTQFGRLTGPFTDGQQGNCDAMFAIFARNVRVLGAAASHAVPVVNPVPPDTVAGAEFYTHHPPGLPWLVMLASRVPAPVETMSRLVALAATIATVLLLADIATRLAGRRAGMAAGLLAALLPAGLHHGLLVNYETVALPSLLLLLRSLVLGVGPPALAGLLAALMDWVALLPLVLLLRPRPGRRWVAAALGAAAGVALTVVLAQLATPAASAGTASQALATTFLAPDFRAGEWLAALGEHLVTLYGLALLPAALAVPLLPRRAPLLRRCLGVLLAVGLLNVVVFARHATGHEHFALLLQPYIVLATATLLFPRDEAALPPARVGVALLVVLLALGVQQFRRDATGRQSVRQSQLALAFHAASAPDVVYVRPEGAPFTFLFGAERHVAPGRAGSEAEAVAGVQAYRERFGLPDHGGQLAVADDEPAPAWLAGRPPDAAAGRFRFWYLPPRVSPGP
jgi:hypothetical protein